MAAATCLLFAPLGTTFLLRFESLSLVGTFPHLFATNDWYILKVTRPEYRLEANQMAAAWGDESLTWVIYVL